MSFDAHLPNHCSPLPLSTFPILSNPYHTLKTMKPQFLLATGLYGSVVCRSNGPLDFSDQLCESIDIGSQNIFCRKNTIYLEFLDIQKKCSS